MWFFLFLQKYCALSWAWPEAERRFCLYGSYQGHCTLNTLDSQWQLGVYSIMIEKSAQSGKWGMHAHPLSLYRPSRTKLYCTLQLRGQIHSPYFYSTPICTLWLYWTARSDPSSSLCLCYVYFISGDDQRIRDFFWPLPRKEYFFTFLQFAKLAYKI